MLSRISAIVAILLCGLLFLQEVTAIEEFFSEEDSLEEGFPDCLLEKELLPAETAPSPVALQMLSLEMIRRNEQGLPGIRIQLSTQSAFTFSRVGRTLYQLTLKDCLVAGEHLLLVHFPPEELKGVQLVQANRKGNDLVINIVVEEQTRLEAIPIENAVWVEVRG